MPVWLLGAAAAAALFGGAVNAAGSHIEDTDNWNSLENQKSRIKEEYKLQLKQAEDDFAKAKEEAERNAKRGEEKADITDLGADITETASSNDFNAAIDSLYLSQAGDTWNWNTAAMQAGSSTGAAYANLASSGVRAGGSMSDAILMESSLNSAQLQFSQDAKRRQDSNNLGSVLNQLAGNRYGIYQNRYSADATRDDAMYLRNSYLEGGHNYNLYQDALKLMEKKKDNAVEALQDKQDEIDRNRHWKAFSAFFGGAAKTGTAAYNIGTKFYEGATYNTTLGGNK